MEKTSAQQCYLRHLRDKVASVKEASEKKDVRPIDLVGIGGGALAGGGLGYIGGKSVSHYLSRAASPYGETPGKDLLSRLILQHPKKFRRGLPIAGILGGALLGGSAIHSLLPDAKEAAATCSASTALTNHLKKKKATITKEAQPQMPSLIDPDTQRRLYEHNTRQLRTAGGLLGTGAGLLGGGGLGAGIGALVSKAGKRLPGAGYGGLIGAAAGGLLGGLTGPGVGQELAGEATQKDIAQLNQLAQQRLIEAGINPFYGDIGVSATFGKNTGDDRPFAIEDYYVK